MSTRRRVATLIALTLAGSGGFAAATATTADRRPTQAPAAVERVHRYYATGPSATYDGDAGGLGEVDPLVWRAPAGSASSAVVSVSFQYRTRGPGPFTVDVGVKPVGGKWLTVRPGELDLAPAPQKDATTVQFLVPDLPGGRRYEAHVFVNSAFAGGGGRNELALRRMLLTVDSTAR